MKLFYLAMVARIQANTQIHSYHQPQRLVKQVKNMWLGGGAFGFVAFWGDKVAGEDLEKIKYFSTEQWQNIVI